MKNLFKKGHIPWNKTEDRWTRKICTGCGITFRRLKCITKRPFHSRECYKQYFAKHSKEWNDRTGKGHDLKTRIKISMTLQGIKDKEDWRGFSQSENRLERERFRDKLQKQILARDNYTCQICGIRGKNMQVDHIQPWAEYVKLRFNMNNCRTLCRECHYKITYGKPMPKNIKTWGQKFYERGVLTFQD